MTYNEIYQILANDDQNKLNNIYNNSKITIICNNTARKITQGKEIRKNSENIS